VEAKWEAITNHSYLHTQEIISGCLVWSQNSHPCAALMKILPLGVKKGQGEYIHFYLPLKKIRWHPNSTEYEYGKKPAKKRKFK
jgi:hypothetical protein